MSVTLPRYLLALGLTLAIELAAALALSFLRPERAPGRGRILRDVLLANLFTHPLATYAVQGLAWSWEGVELLVFAVEAAIYRAITGLPLSRAVLLSLVANGITAALSFVI